MGAHVITLRLFGGLELWGSDGLQLDTVLTQPKRVALLAFLAASPHRFHRRDALLALLWPELDQEHARAALRQALHSLRRALHADVLTSRGDEEVGVDEQQLWCDVRVFRQASDTGDLNGTLELYRGGLLEGFFLSGSPEFERWLEDERSRLRDRACHAAWTLAQRSKAEGDVRLAAQWARRAAALVPDDEETLRRLITLLDELGDRAGAVQVYEEFAKRVAKDYEVKPAPETAALIGTVRARDAARTAPERLPIAFAGSAEIPSTPGVPASPRPPRSRRLGVRRVAWSSAVITVAVALVGGGLYVRGTREPDLSTGRVVVATFANRTGDTSLNRLGELAADWITRGLSETGLVEVADPGAKPPPGGGAAPNEAEAAHSLALATGSEVAVWGAFFRSGDSLEFTAQITDERRRELARSLGPVLGTSADPRPAIAALRQRIIASLAVVLDPRLKDWQGRSSQPPSYAAYREFASGVDAMNRLSTVRPPSIRRTHSRSCGRHSPIGGGLSARKPRGSGRSLKRFPSASRGWTGSCWTDGSHSVTGTCLPSTRTPGSWPRLCLGQSSWRHTSGGTRCSSTVRARRSRFSGVCIPTAARCGTGRTISIG